MEVKQRKMIYHLEKVDIDKEQRGICSRFSCVFIRNHVEVAIVC